MTPYDDTMARLRERRLRTVLALIDAAAVGGDPGALALISSLAHAGLQRNSNPEAEAMVTEAVADLPPEPTGRPADGLGHLIVAVSYEPVDRESLIHSEQYFRVRKGPIMPTKAVLRERALKALEGVLEQIDSIEG